MNLLIVIPTLAVGGAERIAVLMADQWVKDGDTVTIATLSDGTEVFYSFAPDVKKVHLDQSGVSVGLFSALAANIARIAAIRRTMCSLKPDIVIAMTSTVAILCVAASAFLPSRIIAAERTYPPYSEIPWVWRMARSLAYRFADLIVVQTKDGAKWFQQNLPYKRVTVIPNSLIMPLPTHPPYIPVEPMIAHGTSVILSVGRLVKLKDHQLLIRAVAPLLNDYPDWVLVILGEGPERSNLEAVIKQNGLADHVQLPGIAGNLGDWYSRADIFVLPSLFEGFPNSLLEAMAYECACVSFDVKTGPSEMIVDGESGLLLRDRSEIELGTALSTLIANPALRKRLAKAAATASERFSMPVVNQAWRQAFQQLIESN